MASVPPDKREHGLIQEGYRTDLVRAALADRLPSLLSIAHTARSALQLASTPARAAARRAWNVDERKPGMGKVVNLLTSHPRRL
jgi:hypothetical protein